MTPFPKSRRRPSVAVLLAGGLFAAAVHAGDISGVQLAWRNDPRPAADETSSSMTPPGRRPTRREQRRMLRRGEAESRPAPPSPVVIRPAVSQPVVPPAAEPREDIPAEALVHRDLESGGHPRQRFDLFLPEGCSGGGLPLVIWIHGPDWRTGTKADCPVTWLTRQGFAVASIDYRPSDAAVYPAQLDDCLAAVEAIRRDAKTWGIDAGRICVAGSGGGGHLAALVAFAAPAAPVEREAAAEPAAEAGVAAVAVFDAPVHLTSLGGEHDRAGSAESRLVGGPLPEFREAAQLASPLLHVSSACPPALIVHGGRGDGVAVAQGDRLDAALRAAGVESGLVVLDVAVADLAPRAGTPAAGALLEFLDRAVGPAGARHEN
ncbi:MAG: alpha/beta hydrolase fold domain-containing protein [Planctomycetaceae bacterium]